MIDRFGGFFHGFVSACVMLTALTSFTACAGTGAQPVHGLSPGGLMAPALTSAAFTWIATWGADGKKAVAACPTGYNIVGGGTSSSDGSFVGTGEAAISSNAWTATPVGGNVKVEAFASCLKTAQALANFRWVTAHANNNVASASCDAGYTLMTGYGVKTSKGGVSAEWFDSGNNTYWVTGGADAQAGCLLTSTGVFVNHAWNVSQNPKTVYAGCGSGNVDISGSMGDNGWPGPPIQQHPGVGSSPGSPGDAGWWTYSNAANELTWAVCIPS